MNENIIDNTYKIIEEIGRGGTGIVYLGIHMRLQKYVVLKRLRGLSNYISKNSRVEVDVLKNLRHSNLPIVYDFVVDGEDVYTVMDYIEGPTMEQILVGPDNITEEWAVFWFNQVAEVLVYLHYREKPILHSDIKPSNIIITPDGNICLIDFGISFFQGAGIIGLSSNYAAPEQILVGRQIENFGGTNIALDGRIDIYSAGATFYYLLTGIKPNINNYIPISKFTDLPYSLKFLSIVEKCMEPDRENRYQTANELLNELKKLQNNNSGKRRKRIIALLCGAVCSVILFFTVFFVVKQIRANDLNNYISDYKVFINYVESGQTKEAQDKGLEILNNVSYESFIEKRAGEKSQILFEIGKYYYDTKVYSTATKYFKEAIDFAEKTDPNVVTYFKYGIRGFIANEEKLAADQVVSKAEGYGINNTDMLLLHAEANIGNKDRCLEYVNRILSINSSNESKAEACEVAFRIKNLKDDERKEWLEKIGVYNKTFYNTIVNGEKR